MRALARLDLPPVWAALAALTAWALAAALPLVAIPAPAPLAGALVLAGLALIAWTAVLFRRARTPIEPRREASALLTGGPFRINRNPIYTGMALVLLGLAAALGALSAFLPVLAFPLVMTRRFVLEEERRLRAAFGETAEAWLARTRRW